MRIETINVLGVQVSVLNYDLALAAIAEAIAARRKGYVCLAGVHGVTEARADENVRQCFNEAFLSAPDGMPLVWLGKYHGHPEMDRVYGPDLMLAVLRWSEQSGARHFLYGGNPGVAEELAAALRARFPGAEICGTYTPPFRPLDALERAELIAQVEALRPEIVWVGISTPKQERFMHEYLPLLNTTLMFGVGAAFDFHTGRLAQAPRWMQRAGLEWFYRLTREPKRLWKRYGKSNPLFLARTFLQLTGLRKYPL